MQFKSALKDGGFSVRGGAFSLLGPISKAVTEDDAALAAFDKMLEEELLGLQLLTCYLGSCADGQVAAIKSQIAPLLASQSWFPYESCACQGFLKVSTGLPEISMDACLYVQLFSFALKVRCKAF